MDTTKLEEEGTVHNYMPNEAIRFNPSQPADIEALLSKFGPEGLWTIGAELVRVADKDIQDAQAEYGGCLI